MLLLRVSDFIDGLTFMEKWLRRAYVDIRNHINCVRLLGVTGLTLIVRSLLRSAEQIRAEIDGLPMWVRPSSTDMATLLQIFWNRDYAFDMAQSPSIIIDAGANVGYSTLFFARMYPDARIIAIEPHPDNFSQLIKNVQPFPQITPVQAAVWHEDKVLGLWDPEQGHWGFRVTTRAAEPADLEIQGRCIGSLLHEFDLQHVDLLKIDIEGSEKEVFENPLPWIDNIGVIVAELHDKYRVGCARAFYNATNDFPYERKTGENILLMREEYVP